MTRLDFRKANFTRNTELDFTDDGTRFYGYTHVSGMPMTYASFEGTAYISLRVDYLDELNFDEYKELPSYRLADKYSMIDKEKVDMADLDRIATKLAIEYAEAVENLEEISDSDWEQYLAEAKKVAVKKYEAMDKLVKSNFDKIVDYMTEAKSEWKMRTMFDGLKRIKNNVDYIDRYRTCGQATRRIDMRRGVRALVLPMAEDYSCKTIIETINEI